MANAQELRLAATQGDPERQARQRAAGKLTARERVERLVDPGSFVETDTLLGRDGDFAGVVTGCATVQDRPVCLFAQDFTVHGGAMGRQQAQKIIKVLELARKTGCPVLALCDSAGVRVDEGAEAMNAYAQVYAKMTRLSGVVPMIALVLGPVVGGAALISQLADISIQAADVGELMVYGPLVVSAMTGRSLDAKKLGGAEAMAAQGGVALTAANEAEAIALAQRLIDLLPGSNLEDAELQDADDLNRLLTISDPADCDGLMREMADGGSYVELYPAWGQEMRIALARMGGRTVGLVAGNAQVNDGMLTPAAAAKAARFIRFCDCFSLPVVSLINSRGIQVPEEKNQAWTMTAAAKLLYAYAEATTAKVSVVVGSAIGQAYVAMGGQENADITYAWPGSVISALTPEAAVQVLYQKELKAAKGDPLADRKALVERFAAEVADGVSAAAKGMVDDVIAPEQTRQYVIAALEMLSSKQDSNPPKKHGNLPM